MKLLSPQETRNTVEDQQRNKSAELVHIEEILLRKRREIEQLQEIRIKEKDDFARQVESCFVILDNTRDEIRQLEDRKRELLKPVDGILDEAHQLYQRVQAEKRKTKELFETAEVKIVESKQVFIASSNLAKSLTRISEQISEILTLPSDDLYRALREVTTQGKSLTAHAKAISEAAKDIKNNAKHATVSIEEERKNIEKREEEIKKEKKHIRSQQLAIRAALKR